MFSPQKLIWVGVAIYLVWLLFKWFDRRKSPPIPAGEDQHPQADTDTSSVELSECPSCGVFTSPQGCEKENCVMRQK